MTPEDTRSPSIRLPQATPLVLVKPEAGLPTPTVFKALDLNTRSTADPEELLKQLAKGAGGFRRAEAAGLCFGAVPRSRSRGGPAAPSHVPVQFGPTR